MGAVEPAERQSGGARGDQYAAHFELGRQQFGKGTGRPVA
jgi:hypothetical protein